MDVAIIAIFTLMITALFGLLAWFIQQNFKSLKDTDKRLEGKIDKIGDKVGEVSASIIEMQDAFNKLGYPIQRVLTTTSPLKLTEYGEKLVEESGFKKVFSENKVKILDWVREKNPLSKYDVQEFSRTALLNHKEDPIFNSLKEYAFQHSKTSLEQILRAGAIIVRDELIKELGL